MREGISMSDVRHVARYIIEQLGGMTTMKLQKLVYYCQAWSLAWDEKPLFEEEFQAWANGPVCYELFSEHRGKFKVDENFLQDYSDYKFEPDELETIRIVIEHYAEKSPHYLSELTHKERPWKETRGSLPLGESSMEIIPKELMQEYYAGISSAE
ncbi:hypothetical protein B6A11_01275 [Enterococcus faecalis]|nr:SocA family protein [Enterococcus faecalis]EGO8385894.1 DUF4065 domain-containing protein [Enterococcus faecalis]EHF3562851.1 SocA family protein [Enterococcus faecalis]EHR4738374.1 DUF4065 domain-containing protein [Enterococcus faecalis]EKB0687255.1 DUF4065 domain-containing protein [Enterococcus faecalis]